MVKEMNPFNFMSPTRIIYGEGTVGACSAEILAELGGQKPLIISDSILVKTGVLASLLDCLAENKKEAVIFEDVPSDSDVECVRNATSAGREASCDSVIAIGGGSVMDTAKVANIGLSLPGDPLDFEGVNNLPERLLPLLAIPTTAGTGSEVSAVAMIKDHAQQKKLLFGSRFLLADTAMLDPTLIVSLPPRLTAATGLDAVTHALEAYVAIGTNPFSESLALRSLYLLLDYLPQATTNGDDLEARSNTLLASTMAGMSFNNAGVGIVHALSHTIGAKFSVHHGVANAIFLPFGMEFNIEESPLRYAQIWSCLCNAFTNANGGNRHLSAKFIDGSSEGESANLLVTTVKDLIEQCSLPTRLRDVGVPELNEQDLHMLADMAITDPAIMFNPREATHEDLINIIKGAY